MNNKLIACDCDPRGSLEEAICDSYTDINIGQEAGKCHCKKNVEGRRCDRCRNGFWNFDETNPDGCQACACNQFGTVGNLGCNFHTGECVCKRNVVGRDCNSCAPDYYGLSEDEEGCKPCDCDPGGSYSSSCDINTGQCDCRPHVTGRRCDAPDHSYFGPYLDYLVYEAELSKASPEVKQVEREIFGDRMATWTGLGFMRVFPGSTLEFDVTDVPETLDYDIVVRYEPQMPGKWEEVKVTVDRPFPIDPRACNLTQEDTKTIALASTDRYVIANKVCLEKGRRYKIILEINQYDRAIERETASVLIDSVAVIPRIENIPFFKGNTVNEYKRQEFERFRCGSAYYTVVRPADPIDICKKYLYSIGFYVFGGAYSCNCDPTGSVSTVCNNLGGGCQCRPHIVGRQCERCRSGYYGFGPEGCKPCDCHSVGSLDNFCDLHTGQCKCRPGTFGRQCNECQPGFWNYPNCQRCDCNGHSDMCDSRTGVCINCRDYTTGPHCERCERGYYGNPLLTDEVSIPCRACPCPGIAGSGMTHAETCELDFRTQNVICHCKSGYSGERCDRCANNYWGDPTVVGGECRPCDCNNNIDIAQQGNCDARTGECLKCLYNTGGHNCGQCKSGYWGDASRQQCIECVCNPLGTDPNGGSCDHQSGQCPCLPNVIGKTCDRCAINHWKIASGTGCEACDCDPQGAYTLKCNEFDGQCHCKPGHGGRQCNECQPNYWGDPRFQCYECECNPSGAATQQCSKTDGKCVCIEGISGHRCDRCARGYTGTAPHCEPCGECFDNWDAILTILREHTHKLLDAARRIKQTGTTGAYALQFEEIEAHLNETDRIISGQNISESDLLSIVDAIEKLRKNLTETQNMLSEYETDMDDTNKRITSANLALQDLKRKADDIKFWADVLKQNATDLKIANVDGAFNITKEAQRRSRASEQRIRETLPMLYESEGIRRQTEKMLVMAESQYNASYSNNELALNDISLKIGDLERRVPNINALVCDGTGTVNECDVLCGGAGCDKCGGLSCTQGATTKAENAYDLATNAGAALKEKEQKARDGLNRIMEARIKSDEALHEAKAAYERAMTAKNTSESTSADVQELLERIEEFLREEAARPAEIRTVADECLALQISLQPQQIQELARQINETINGLTDITKILMETADDLANANRLKDRADIAKARADAILGQAEDVKNALKEAAEAQRRAEAAIAKANADIKSATGDLEQIESETEVASGNSDKAAAGIDDLQGRLEELKRRFTQNEIDVRKADGEARLAARDADEADQNARELELKFGEAARRLEDKAKVSGAVKERAENLRERTKKLAENANAKLGSLQEMEDLFHDNESRLKDYQKIIDDLNDQMMNHLMFIEARSKHYRECQA